MPEKIIVGNTILLEKLHMELQLRRVRNKAITDILLAVQKEQEPVALRIALLEQQIVGLQKTIAEEKAAEAAEAKRVEAEKSAVLALAEECDPQDAGPVAVPQETPAATQ